MGWFNHQPAQHSIIHHLPNDCAGLQQVFANFTFGEPVRGGRCSIVVWAPLMRWETRSSQAGLGGFHRWVPENPWAL